MRDYMTALQRRFHICSERSEELKREARAAYDTLHDTLGREQQKLLLRLIDAEISYRDEEKLDAFFSGFKLADGIRQELGKPYSYEGEDEQQAREAFRRAHGEEDQH
ncbi:MAG: hypothetical protein E7422_11305 [Ruminococcaceae bacterium]|nr:hypothetical protein [Oscillospiraceae bacterium]